MVLIPMARMLGTDGPRRHYVPGLVFVHLVYGIGFSTLYFRNYYAAFPTELVRAAQIDGAGLLPHLLAHPAAVVRTDRGGLHHLAVHQYLERLPVRRVFLRLRQRSR